jgi:hypothetical protein
MILCTFCGEVCGGAQGRLRHSIVHKFQHC